MRKAEKRRQGEGKGQRKGCEKRKLNGNANGEKANGVKVNGKHLNGHNGKSAAGKLIAAKSGIVAKPKRGQDQEAGAPA